MICEQCGAGNPNDSSRCQYCGSYLPKSQQTTPSSQPTVVNIYNTVQERVYQEQLPPVYAYTQPTAYQQPSFLSPKRKWTAFFLCLLFGYLGAHKFYVGRWAAGLIYLCTFGLGGLGIVIDLLVILLGGATDKRGRKLS